MTEELMTTPSQKVPEALDQSSGDEQLSENEDDEERHFSMLMESSGASNVFEESVLMFYTLFCTLRYKNALHLMLYFISARVRFAACGLDSGKMSLTSCPTLKNSWPVSHIKSKRHDKRGRRWRAPSGGDMVMQYEMRMNSEQYHLKSPVFKSQ